jgi:hypothetical protein
MIPCYNFLPPGAQFAWVGGGGGLAPAKQLLHLAAEAHDFLQVAVGNQGQLARQQIADVV